MNENATNAAIAISGPEVWRRRIELTGQLALAALAVAFPAALGWVPGWADGRATVDASYSEILLVIPCMLLLPLAAVALSLRPGAPRLAWLLPFALFGGFIAIGLFQTVSLPRGLHFSLSPGFEELAQRYWPSTAAQPDYPRPLSLDPRSTTLAVIRLFAALSCMLCAFAFVRSGRDALRVLVPQAAAAAAVSFLALLKSGVIAAWGANAAESVSFIFPLGSASARASGPFINANQLAGYLEIAFPVIVALMIASGAGDDRGRGGMLARLRDPRQMMLATCALLVAGAALASQSRLGILALIAGASVLAALLTRKLGVRGRTVFAGGVMVAAFFAYLGLEPILNRYALLVEKDVSRVEAWEMGAKIVKDFPALGTGMGTFHRVSPAYTPAVLKNHYFQAHNDYINVASETGIIGLAFIIAAAASFVWMARKGLRSPDKALAAISAASLAAAAAMAVHAAGDFNLQVGSIMFHMSLLAGIGLAAAASAAESGAGRVDEAGAARVEEP